MRSRLATRRIADGASATENPGLAERGFRNYVSRIELHDRDLPACFALLPTFDGNFDSTPPAALLRRANVSQL